MSRELNNPLDNSDVPIRENKHSAVGGLFESIEQAQQYKLYLETLTLVASLKKSTETMVIVVGQVPDGSGKMVDKTETVSIKNLIIHSKVFIIYMILLLKYCLNYDVFHTLNVLNASSRFFLSNE